MDYWGTFLVKNPDAAAIRAAVRKTILARKGIQAVTSIDLTVDSVARVLTVKWAAISDVGALSAVAVIGS
jgi:hypothetical protein